MVVDMHDCATCVDHHKDGGSRVTAIAGLDRPPKSSSTMCRQEQGVLSGA